MKRDLIIIGRSKGVLIIIPVNSDNCSDTLGTFFKLIARCTDSPH